MSLSPILNASDIYSGMYIRVTIRFFAYSNAGNKGVGCGLNNVLKVEDGEPLSGRDNAESDFSGIVQAQQPAANAQPQAPYYAPKPPYQAQQPTPMPAQQPAIDPITGQPIAPIMGI